MELKLDLPESAPPAPFTNDPVAWEKFVTFICTRYPLKVHAIVLGALNNQAPDLADWDAVVKEFQDSQN